MVFIKKVKMGWFIWSSFLVCQDKLFFLLFSCSREQLCLLDSLLCLEGTGVSRACCWSLKWMVKEIQDLRFDCNGDKLWLKRSLWLSEQFKSGLFSSGYHLSPETSSCLGQCWLSFTLERKPSVGFKLLICASLSNRLSVPVATSHVSA